MDLQNSRISGSPELLGSVLLSALKKSIEAEDPLLAATLTGIRFTARGTTILVSNPLTLVKIRYYESRCRAEIDIVLSKFTPSQTTGILRFRV